MEQLKIMNLCDEFEKTCCFTGYRPSKYPFSFNSDNGMYRRLENDLLEAVFSMHKEDCRTFISGVAMGFDILAAEIVLLLKQHDSSVKLICAVPFREQSKTYTKDWKSRYKNVLESADEVKFVSEDYFQGCYFKRNKFMVDRSDFIITWFDGRKGGTSATLDYARKLGRGIINLNADFCGDY